MRKNIRLICLAILFGGAWGCGNYESDRKTEDQKIAEADRTKDSSEKDQTLLPEIPWAKIPAGSYFMGTERTYETCQEEECQPEDFYNNAVHEVTLNSFWMSKTEVTVAQYMPCIEAGVCQKGKTIWNCESDNPPERCGYEFECNFHYPTERAGHPVNCIDYEEAQIYANWVGARLPTEAEWEYVATGLGISDRFPWGGEDQREDDIRCPSVWMSTPATGVCLTAFGCGKSVTMDVAHLLEEPDSLARNDVHDLIGNVFEWTSDRFCKRYDVTRSDGRSVTECPDEDSDDLRMVVRGGASVTDTGPWIVMPASDYADEGIVDCPVKERRYIGDAKTRTAYRPQFEFEWFEDFPPIELGIRLVKDAD